MAKDLPEKHAKNGHEKAQKDTNFLTTDYADFTD
jgi:hypothetical protein